VLKLGGGIANRLPSPSWADIMNCCQRTPRDWFAEAMRCYLERHQGCAWCHQSHCVYQTTHGHEREYWCNACDFRTSYDAANDHYSSYPGEDPAQLQSPADDN
jgi:hypothetical protein